MKRLLRWIFDRRWWAEKLGKVHIGIDVSTSYDDGICMVFVKRWFGRCYVVEENWLPHRKIRMKDQPPIDTELAAREVADAILRDA